MITRILTHGSRLAQPLALALLATQCAATAAVETLPDVPGVLSVVTWNMNAGRGDLPRLVGDLDAGLLGSPAAESVLLLQEAVKEDLPRMQRLADARRSSLLFVPVHYDGNRTRGNAILSSRPILDPRAIPLPRERQPRIAAAGAIDVAGQRLFVVSAHLENRLTWWRAGFGSHAARGRQAAALVGALPAEGPGIVGGDFNTWLGADEPAWRVLNERFDDSPGSPRRPTFRGHLILDHVFVDLPAGWRAVAAVVEDTYGSDHHPVVATVTPAAP